MRKILGRIILATILNFGLTKVNAQTPYPEPFPDQSYITAAPDAQAAQGYSNTPVALYEGLPVIGIPIYTVKCGSLSLPISLSYNYNGLYPQQEASWVGLGWNLNAGGVITRIIEGYVDSTQNSGYNYGQYNIVDTLFNSYNFNNFLQHAYNYNLNYLHQSYDLAPDVFDCEMNGYSGRFIYYNGKPYQLSFDKNLSNVTWPYINGSIAVTTADGTVYTFTAKDTSTNNVYGGPSFTQVTYVSAWHLSMMVSADKKDTITLTYNTHNWQQQSATYQSSYTVSNGTQPDLGKDSMIYNINPLVKSKVLQSIQCRNSRVSFISNVGTRTDMTSSYPFLTEIDIIDSLTGNTVKKNKLRYEYFGQTTTNPADSERLKLKRFNSVNTLLPNDTLTYTFKYNHEYGSFPAKTTMGYDYWGFYNGQDTNTSILPKSTSLAYMPSPPVTSVFGGNRSPFLTYLSYGVLDTLVYPAGGYTVFQYAENDYLNSSNVDSPGGGLRIQNITNYSNNSATPSLQKTYSYVQDNGTYSSGVLGNPFIVQSYPYTVFDGTNTYPYTMYRSSDSGPGAGGGNPLFYYQKVTEQMSSGGETHKTDHYFTAYINLFLEVHETERIDYLNTVGTNLFAPLSKTSTTYSTVNDTSFYAVNPYVSGSNYNLHQHPPITDTLSFAFFYSSWTMHWVYPSLQQSTQYDIKGDSMVNTVNLNYNTTTRNLVGTTQGTSDGQMLVQKFKYPEDYTSSLTGNMVTAHVISPVIEKQTWMKKDASDSLLIGGSITSFDQTVFKPISSYAIETTAPISGPNNETKTGSLYNTLLSDSRYILKAQYQYDANDNASTVNKASDMNISYIYDYRHAQPIAQVTNASQADIAFTSFEADGKGNWVFTGSSNADATSPTGSNCYNIGQTSGSLTKSGLTSATNYIVSYWIKGSSALSITGTVAGYPIQGKTINGWTYFEHKVTGQTTITVSGSGITYVDEVRLYPYSAQMTSFTYMPLVGKTSQCDQDNRITYYQYDGFGRLKVVLDQDHNITKTVQYHYNGETTE